MRLRLVELTFDVSVVHIRGCRFAGNPNQKVTQFGRQVAQCQDRQNVAIVEETKLLLQAYHHIRDKCVSTAEGSLPSHQPANEKHRRCINFG